MEEAISATRLPRRRAPRSFQTGRVCSQPDCGTVLSRYNKADKCNRHRPIKFPRTRGVLKTEPSGGG